ncbi:hypothetical protein SPHINGO391_500127 [Sphingomonas aurantiaca]|uniref:Uncharacterized protein n=1 Tax=Sphingomonas aurantiaca TaxID=185949 RepID=A0A5E8AEW8_9SPHN|nr:hypothetical protein SPHINGO391_500127 [Sphingomonas aurantiaca]
MRSVRRCGSITVQLGSIKAPSSIVMRCSMSFVSTGVFSQFYNPPSVVEASLAVNSLPPQYLTFAPA